MRQGQSLNPLYYINNINVKSKFIVLAIVVFVPIVLFMWMNINRLSNEIAFSSTERRGVAFISPVRQLIENAQAHRGMSNAYLSGKYSLKKKIDQAEQRADAAILEIERLDQQYGAKFNTQQHWQAIKQDWSSLKQLWAKAKASPTTVQASVNFGKHTALIDSLLDYVLFLSDKSGLTVDPEVDTYYLIDIVYFRTLNVIENMGKIRGLGAGVAARKAVTPAEATKLSIMSAQVTSLLKDYAHDMEVLKSVHKEAEIKPSMDRLQASIAALNKMVKQELLETETITVDSARYFEEASKSIKLSYETFDELSGVLGHMLATREQEQQSLLNQILILSCASLAIVGFLLVSIARNVVQKSSQLKARMYDLVHGQFDQSGIKLKHAKDELGEAIHSADMLGDTLKK